MDILQRAGYFGCGKRLAEEALQLLLSANCPSGKMDLLLMPEQMMLQIHESIGHPLELDRILGDERNYAGTSFVTLDMFGKYQYGSNLLNVTYDPSHPEEIASFAFDDEGSRAEKVFLIRNGILERPLGGHISQIRAGKPGVANSRASGWNRAPIDRMANLNIEPGNTAFERYDRKHREWDIDDDQHLMVDRRFAQQISIWLRMGSAHRKRQTRHSCKKSELSRHFFDILAQSTVGR